MFGQHWIRFILYIMLTNGHFRQRIIHKKGQDSKSTFKEDYCELWIQNETGKDIKSDANVLWRWKTNNPLHKDPDYENLKKHWATLKVISSIIILHIPIYQILVDWKSAWMVYSCQAEIIANSIWLSPHLLIVCSKPVQLDYVNPRRVTFCTTKRSPTEYGAVL